MTDPTPEENATASAIELKPHCRPFRTDWRILFIVVSNFLAMSAWWYKMPHGFPLGHAKCWTNQVLPIIGALICAAVLLESWRRRDGRWLTLTAMACGAMWCGAAISLFGVFPISGMMRAPPILLAGLYMLWTANKCCGSRDRRWSRGCSILVGLAFGIAMVVLERSPDPSTHPTDFVLPILPKNVVPESAIESVRLANGARISPREGDVNVQMGPLALTVEPLLTFISRSPDRFWTSFAPRNHRVSPPLVLTGMQANLEILTLAYASDYASILEVTSRAGATQIDAASALLEPIYSHLNSYTRIFITGHRRLFLSFSPCPGEKIEVIPFDYPVGRPARAAYLGADGIFRVVQATSAEKGPFRTLAQGALERGQPLSIDLFDEDRPAGRITWLDWSAQADTSLSPTAGWGLPANAIEFSLEGDEPDDAAAIYMTLAGTSLGRGWDSVGHAAGTYRNRIRIESGQ